MAGCGSTLGHHALENAVGLGGRTGVLLIHHGGPRHLHEVGSFCHSWVRLLHPKGTPHDPLAVRLQHAWKNHLRHLEHSSACQMSSYDEVELLAERVRTTLHHPLFTLHYLIPSARRDALWMLETAAHTLDSITVLPLFPCFSYSLTGVQAAWLHEHASPELRSKLLWIKSFGSHPAYVLCWQQALRRLLQHTHKPPREVGLVCVTREPIHLPAHKRDPFLAEVTRSAKAIANAFPGHPSRVLPLPLAGSWNSARWHKQISQLTQEMSCSHWILWAPCSPLFDPLLWADVESAVAQPLTSTGCTVSQVTSLIQEPTWPETCAMLTEQTEYLTPEMLVP